MSKLTDFLSLFKWDTSNETDKKTAFNIEKALNENWDKLDEQLESLDSRVTTNEANVETNADNITVLQDNATTNEKAITEIKETIAEIQSEQEEQNTKIANREHKHSYYTYKVEEDISSGTSITLPCSYVVGSDNLVLYDFFGHRLIKDEHYSEIGDDGAESTTITLLFDVMYSEEYEKVFDIIIKEVDV